MKRRILVLALSAAAMLVVSCGSSDSSTNAPQAQNPNNTGTTPIAVPTVAPNGVPDLSRSVPIQLPTANDYSRFGELLEEQIYMPVVGNPEIQISGAVSRQSPYTASSNTQLLIGIEDNYGWTGAIWNTYQPASTYINSQLNLYFSDTDTTVWVAGAVDSSGTWNGTILYRMRAPGEVQCEPQTFSCTPSNSQYCINWVASQQQQARDACIAYMNPSSSTKVKVLGYFSKPSVVSTSGWLTVQ